MVSELIVERGRLGVRYSLRTLLGDADTPQRLDVKRPALAVFLAGICLPPWND